jgi:hypothetical protein
MKKTPPKAPGVSKAPKSKPKTATTKDTTAKHAGGRPSKYRAEYPAQAEKLCALGAIDTDLAAFFAVHVDTIAEWKVAHPEFSDAIKRAKDNWDAKVERSLCQRAMGYSHPAVKILQYEGNPIEVPYTEHYAPDTAACIFWLKNRQPDRWREKVEIVPVALCALPRGGGGARRTPGPVGARALQVHHHHLRGLDPGGAARPRDHDRHLQPHRAAREEVPGRRS